MIKLFILLMFGHALADFALQTDIMAKLKNRHNKPDWIPNGQKFIPCWPYWMSAHALIHGGTVYVITNSLVVGVTESIMHFIIDMLKCENKTNPNTDQLLHILCRIGYVIYLN